jgi:hypothetical protein
MRSDSRDPAAVVILKTRGSLACRKELKCNMHVLAVLIPSSFLPQAVAVVAAMSVVAAAVHIAPNKNEADQGTTHTLVIDLPDAPAPVLDVAGQTFEASAANSTSFETLDSAAVDVLVQAFEAMAAPLHKFAAESPASTRTETAALLVAAWARDSQIAQTEADYVDAMETGSDPEDVIATDDQDGVESDPEPEALMPPVVQPDAEVTPDPIADEIADGETLEGEPAEQDDDVPAEPDDSSNAADAAWKSEDADKPGYAHGRDKDTKDSKKEPGAEDENPSSEASLTDD